MMKRGDVLNLDHPTQNVEVKFNKQGEFILSISNFEKTMGSNSDAFTSMREFIYHVLTALYKVEPDQVYQHINGNTYKVLFLANENTQREDYPVHVVYQGKNGLIWTKPLINFLNKMTRIK